MSVFTVRWKNSSADLHKKSPYIFLGCLCFTLLLTAILLHIPIPIKEMVIESIEVPPFILLVNIPKTRQVTQSPAPARPFIQSSLPIAVDEEFMPDDITIEDTHVDGDISLPPLPGVSGSEEGTVSINGEEEIYDSSAIEEEPSIINNITPKYPLLAKRAGIEGIVFVKVLVNKEGLVDSIEVLKGPKIFHTSATEAARATQFTPAKQNSKPVSCWVVIPYRFVLQN